MVLAIGACTPRGGGGPVADTGGGDATSDGTTAQDTGGVQDTGRPDTVTADRPQPTDTGGGGDFGTCGQPVRQCLCGCPAMDAMCQNGCITSSMACNNCIGQAQLTCCPTEGNAFGMCIQRNMCMDQACVNANCRTEQTAFQMCFARQQQMAGACQDALRGCLGSDFPMLACE